MKLSEPKVITFFIALIVGIVGFFLFLLGTMGSLGFWLVTGAFVLLAIANLIKGL